MIPFKYGTQEQYNAQVKDNSALYFISDTHRIYRGEELIAGVSALVVEELPTFASAVSGVIYVLAEGDTAKLYIKGDSDVVPIYADVATESIKSIDVFDPDIVVTSYSQIDDKDENSLITAKTLKEAITEATGTWEYLDGTKDSTRIYG